MTNLTLPWSRGGYTRREISSLCFSKPSITVPSAIRLFCIRGVTEGVTLLLLALQTGLLDMQTLQRSFLLSIILFIVVTSTLQSMIEITDPIILALGASRNRWGETSTSDTVTYNQHPIENICTADEILTNPE